MTAIIEARAFGGGLPATGALAQLELDNETLRVRCVDDQYAVPLTDVRLREIGTGERGLELAWDGTGGLMAVHLFGTSAVTALETRLNATPQFRTLNSTRRRAGIGRSIAWVAFAALIALPLLLILLFVWQSDRLAAVAAARISIEQEAQLGGRMFEGLRAQLKIVDSGPRHAAVAAIGERLTRGSKYKYRFHVAEDESINAFAVPGGIVVVHTGLIDATRKPEELAGVLAHEVQHIEQRHSLTGLIKQVGLSAVWMFVGGDASGILGNAALELTTLKFSRDAESRADAAGFDALIAANIDPRGMPGFFEVMRAREGVIPPPFLSTHPDSAARKATLRERLIALGERRFEALQFNGWPPASRGDESR